MAAVILLATDAGQNTDLGQFIGDTVEDSVNGIKDFIQESSN